jgi:hypothetical protein
MLPAVVPVIPFFKIALVIDNYFVLRLNFFYILIMMTILSLSYLF